MHRPCHMLIGCPGSGKSTAAKAILEIDSNWRIVSSDRVRFKLFGDEAIQGNWQLIEAEILLEIAEHLDMGNSIIYDATNAVRSWRIDFLEKMQKYSQLDFIGWHLQTPLDVCQEWNLKRSRQVLPSLIAEMHASLQAFPPVVDEGFAAVYPIYYSQGKLDLNGIKQKIDSLTFDL